MTEAALFVHSGLHLVTLTLEEPEITPGAGSPPSLLAKLQPCQGQCIDTGTREK